MNIRFLLLVAVLLDAPATYAKDITGIWKYNDAAVWIVIDGEKGTGVVARNDEHPDRVGKDVLKDLVPVNAEEGVWKAQILADGRDRYRDADITLVGLGQMNIKAKWGIFFRNFEWLRYKEVPDASQE